jgi:cyclic pyranopterin phosphate synthase
MSRRKPPQSSRLKSVRKSGGPQPGLANAGDGLTHLDRRGRVRMVDIGKKASTRREAIARGSIEMSRATLTAIVGGKLKKGEALAAARLAGIMAAKRTHELIPLCHQIPIESVRIDFRVARDHRAIEIEARAFCEAKTGIEMEALVAVSAAALTLYDMAKAIDRAMVIGQIRLVRKTGGRSGDFVRAHEDTWFES